MTAIVVFVAAVMFVAFGIIKIIGAIDSFKRRRMDAAIDYEFSVLEKAQPLPGDRGTYIFWDHDAP